MNLARKGFTLIELLVVIAIIALLTAIVLPVYASAKRNAYRNADMSNMNQLRTALQLYKTDQGGYPPSLLGYATQYSSGPNEGNLVPADQVQGPLYPKRVNSVNTFEPSLDKGVGAGPITLETVGGPSGSPQVYWPNGPTGNEGSNACVGSSPDAACNEQRFGPTTPVWHCEPGNGDRVYSVYYRISGYDVARVTTQGGAVRDEIHYSPFWSGFTVPFGCGSDYPFDAPGSSSDNPRQLGYSDPPETTVVTWDSYFRDYDSSGNPVHQKQDIVLFLGGDARPYDSATVAANAWQMLP